MAKTATLEEVEDRYLNREDAAAYLGIDPTTLDRWVNRGVITKYRSAASNQTVRFRLSELASVWQPVPVVDEVAEAHSDEEGFEWE